MQNFILGVTTYMDVAEADLIVQDEFEDNEKTLWNSFDNEQKQRLILNGTRKINNLVWRGIQYPGFQSMPWPRLIQYRYVECPYEVKVGILKQAIQDKIYNSKEETSLINSGIKEYRIKGASITFDNNAANANRLTNGIWMEIYRDYLEKWIA